MQPLTRKARVVLLPADPDSVDNADADDMGFDLQGASSHISAVAQALSAAVHMDGSQSLPTPPPATHASGRWVLCT